MKEMWRIVLRPDPTIIVPSEYIAYLVSLAPEGFKPFEYLPDNGEELVIGGLEFAAENIAQVSIASMRAAVALRRMEEKKGKSVASLFEMVMYYDPVKE